MSEEDWDPFADPADDVSQQAPLKIPAPDDLSTADSYPATCEDDEETTSDSKECVLHEQQSMALANRPPLCYDRDLVTLAKLMDIDEIRTRIDWRGADMNAVVPDKLAGTKGRYAMMYIEERTALIASIEVGCEAVFDLLLGYVGIIDLDVVCLEWTETCFYKKYTALDTARQYDRPAMYQRLVDFGASSADDLPDPVRENPFDDLPSHFAPTDGDGGYAGVTPMPGEKNPNAYTHPGNRQCNNKMGPSQKPASSNCGGYRSTDTTSSLDEPEPGVSCPSKACKVKAPRFDDANLDGVVDGIANRLNQETSGSAEIRQKLMRQLFLEWHPDKRPYEEEMATQVFQWLQDVRAKYVGGS